MTTHSAIPSSLRRTTLALCLAASLPAAAAGTRPIVVTGSHQSTAFGKRGIANTARQMLMAANVARPVRRSKNTQGTGIVVQNCDAAGPGSLRDAIANAQDGDVIDLSDLTCASGEIRLTPASGGTISTVVPNLKIIGPGADALTIHGDDANPVFRTLFAGLEITDLTIAHGRTADGFGGCLFIGGDLTLIRSTVTGCRAGDGTNGESYGGGADVLGNLTMENSTISDSTALAANTAYGGAAYVQGSVTLRASTIRGNSARSAASYAYGGGLAVKGDASILDGSRLFGNTARSESGRSSGGALSTLGATDIRDGSAVTSNVSESGSARSMGGGLTGAGDIEIERSTIESNRASSACLNCPTRGGGIFGYGTVTAFASSVIGNSAEGVHAFGAGIATDSPEESGAMLLANSTISGNRALGTQSGAGGGAITLYGSPFAVYNSTIAFNEATTFGGGIAGSDTATMHPLIVNSIIALNSASEGADVDSAYLQEAFTIEGSNNVIISTNHVDFTSQPLTQDPKLMPLFSNGGPTRTHALASCSPAVNAGTHVKLANDQRGSPFVRQFGTAPDIGAFENQPNGDLIFGSGFEMLPNCE